MSKLKHVLMYILVLSCFSGAFYAMSIIPSENESNEENTTEESKLPESLQRVQVMEIVPHPFTYSIEVPGLVEALKDISLGASISGIVEKVSVEEGDTVQKGQELFQIDLRARKAMLKEAEAAYELAKKNVERLEPLYKSGDVSAQAFDEAQSNENQAEARKQRMEVEITLGQITAPVSGIVDRVDAEVGEFMGEGMTLGRLLKLDRVKLSVGVPERYADAVSREKTAQVYIEAINETRTAKIDRVAYGANTQTNTFEALLVLDNPDYRIRPGMIVRSSLVVKREPDALLIPLFALVKRESGMSVFVEKGGKVESRPITIGFIQRDQVEVLDGLNPHEHIVVVGHKDLVDGQKVRVMDTVDRSIEFVQKEMMK